MAGEGGRGVVETDAGIAERYRVKCPSRATTQIVAKGGSVGRTVQNNIRNWIWKVTTRCGLVFLIFRLDMVTTKLHRSIPATTTCWRFNIDSCSARRNIATTRLGNCGEEWWNYCSRNNDDCWLKVEHSVAIVVCGVWIQILKNLWVWLSTVSVHTD